MSTFRICTLLFSLLGFVEKGKAQFDAVELIPAAVVPIFNEAQFYSPGWALCANYYYDDSPNYSLYGGLGVHQMFVRHNESGYFPFFAIQTYYGAQVKIDLKEEIMDIALGGEIGWMLRLYAGNVFNNTPTILPESSFGLSPKVAFHWRPNASWCTLGVQCKYNAYFSFSQAFYGNTFQSGVHQWLQPGISVKAYL